MKNPIAALWSRLAWSRQPDGPVSYCGLPGLCGFPWYDRTSGYTLMCHRAEHRGDRHIDRRHGPFCASEPAPLTSQQSKHGKPER